MSIGVGASIGRCGGVEGSVSIRQHLFGGATANGLELLDRLEATPLQSGVSVDEWLARNPAIRAAIRWEHGRFFRLLRTSTLYIDWPDEDKDALRALVESYAECRLQPLADPPTNQLNLEDDERVRTELSGGTAKTWYLAYLAHSLAVEMGRWVPWSLADYSDDELSHLLASRSMFTWRRSGNYEIELEVHAEGVPARPRFTYEFLFENDLIGHDRLDTVARVLDWCRWHMRHMSAHLDDGGEPVGGDYSV